MHEVGREFVLGRVLQPLIPEYDVILIDCQPSLGLLTVNALACADGVLVPLECEYFALRGVALLMETIEKVSSRLSPKLAIDGVLGHHVRLAYAAYPRSPGQRGRGFGDKVFHTVISRTVRFPDATVAGEPITQFDPPPTGRARTASWPRRYWTGGVRGCPGVPPTAGKPAGGIGAAAPGRRALPEIRAPAPGQRPGDPLPEDHRLPVRQRAARAGARPAGPARPTGSRWTAAGSSARRWPCCSPTSTPRASSSLVARRLRDGTTRPVARPPGAAAARTSRRQRILNDHHGDQRQG